MPAWSRAAAGMGRWPLALACVAPPRPTSSMRKAWRSALGQSLSGAPVSCIPRTAGVVLCP
eukprot:9305879-Heterocapsa_arctica.AAC.1